MPEITSLHNPRVKNAVRLREAKHRREQQKILIDGVREISRALECKVRVVDVFFCPALCTAEEHRRLLSNCHAQGAEVWEVPAPVFAKLAYGDRAEGMVAVAETPSHALADFVLPENPLVAVLECVEKPGNVGAVLRSADAAGVSALILADGQTDVYNPNAIRASLGTIFSVPIFSATAAETLTWLRERGLRIFAARVDGAVPYTQGDYRQPLALVLGSEAQGLTSLWHAVDVQAIRLPQLGIADSLNVSATAAVLFYEALRQRG